MRLLSIVALLCANAICFAQPEWKKKDSKSFTIHYTATDEELVASLEAYLLAGEKSVTLFFNHPFKQKFDVFLFPSRAALDAQWQKDWGASDFKSECWMVASGVGSRLDILSPNAWVAEACEHDAARTEVVQKLITHELAHVYHGQHNPKPTFDGMDDLAWLIEGVAVFASGQLDDKRIQQVKSMIQSGKAPGQLNKFWSGQARYGQAGSLIAYMDKIIHREKLFGLLAETSQEVILKSLGKTEAELIEGWKNTLK